VRIIAGTGLFCAVIQLQGCSSECLPSECEAFEEIPWDGGDGAGSGGGYGEDDEDTEDTVEREIITVRDCSVTLKTIPAGSPSTLQASGEFNDWGMTALSGPDADGVWSADLGELDPGEYGFKYVIDGEYEDGPPRNAYTKWSGGVENRNLRVGDCTTPLLQTVAASTGSGTLSATIQLASAADGTPIDPDAVIVTVGGVAVTPEVDVEAGTITVSLSGLTSGQKHSVKVWASDEAGRPAENEPLFIPLWVEDEPFVWDDGLMYFAFVDRFRNGDWGEAGSVDSIDGVAECANYNGGDFLGVIHALQEGYFEAMGVNTIWLSPVYDNPEDAWQGVSDGRDYSGYHGYWPIHASEIEDSFGDADSPAADRLRELIGEAHSRGIRVLFDLVLNHVHQEHVWRSEHSDWFDDASACVCGSEGCGWDEKAVECWFTDYLPDLSYKNHDVLMGVSQATLDLIIDYDIDAIRVDAAKHMDHVIMRTLSMRIRDEIEAGGGAEVYIVGETFTSDRDLIMDYVSDTELDGQFDFPLYYAIRSAFVDGGSFYDLESAVSAGQSTYGDARMSPFLGNHDIERFATAVTGAAGDCWSDWLEDPMAEGGENITQWDVINKASMAFAFTLTQPGVPLIYYGDEIGLHGGGDPDNRRLMNFDPYLSANQAELLGRVQAIGSARAASAALRRGERVQLWVDDSLLVYARDNGGGDVAIVAINKGGGSRSESIPVSSLGIDGVTLTDAIDGSPSVTVSGGSLSLSLGSQEYAVLVRP
jgi:glycosidase